MNANPEMCWTCPDCQARNASSIPADAQPGRVVDVYCRSCQSDHEASLFFAGTQGGTPMAVGVVWV
jgi:hypothetical protein